MPTELESFQTLIDGLATSLDADIYLFSSAIFDDQTDRLVDTVRKLEKRRTNAALVLCTNGGSADAGFRLARCLKKNYKKLVLFVFGNCKSTGTLVAVGANEIVMSEFGQFGPLDVQLADKDEFYGQTPALDVSQSISTLSESAFNCFIDHFLKLEPGRSLSTKTACEIAKSLTLGIVEPIASQIDPILLGRVDRSMKIADAYIMRLNPNFMNSKKLIGGYPSHDFVIDFEEAKTLFQNIREPSAVECEAENILRRWNRVPKQSDWIGVLSSQIKDAPNENNAAATTGNDGANGGGAIPNLETRVSAPAPRKKSARRTD